MNMKLLNEANIIVIYLRDIDHRTIPNNQNVDQQAEHVLIKFGPLYRVIQNSLCVCKGKYLKWGSDSEVHVHTQTHTS
jgi:hypothetical protein